MIMYLISVTKSYTKCFRTPADYYNLMQSFSTRTSIQTVAILGISALQEMD